MKTRSRTADAVTSDGVPSTSGALALDETASWLCERVPDRVPPGVPLLALAHPSWLSAAAGEYGRRLRSELGRSVGFAEDLEDLIEQLPSKLLAYNPSRDELAALRERIDDAVDDVRNPRAPQALPGRWLEAAAELGVTLPKARHYSEDGKVRADAEELLYLAFARCCTDQRLREVELQFRRESLSDSPSPDARRARAVLAGHHMLPPASGVFAMTELEIRSVSPIADIEPTNVTSMFGGGLTIGYNTSREQRRSQTWYVGLLRDLGEREVPHPKIISYAQEHAALEKSHQANAYGQDRHDNDRGFRRAAEDLARGLSPSPAWTEARALAASHTDQFAAQRLRVLAALDAALARMPIGGAFWFTRLVRNNVAELSEKEDGALDGMRAWGVRVQTTATAGQ